MSTSTWPRVQGGQVDMLLLYFSRAVAAKCELRVAKFRISSKGEHSILWAFSTWVKIRDLLAISRLSSCECSSPVENGRKCYETIVLALTSRCVSIWGLLRLVKWLLRNAPLPFRLASPWWRRPCSPWWTAKWCFSATTSPITTNLILARICSSMQARLPKNTFAHSQLVMSIHNLKTRKSLVNQKWLTRVACIQSKYMLTSFCRYRVS